MADDALKQALVAVDFKAGELPTPAKLTGSIDQLRLAIAEIDRAIGDLYSQQGHVPALSQVLPSGPSLTRTVGASGRINPRQVGRIRVTDREVVFVRGKQEGATNSYIDGFRFYSSSVFQLPYPPIQITSSEGAADFTFTNSADAGGLTISAPGGSYTDATGTGTGKIQTSKRQASLAEVEDPGDWFVSDDGFIFLYSPLDDDEGFKVTYTFDSLPTSYDGASFNVVPDFSQTGVLCTVALVSGTTYTITLPTASKMRGETLANRPPAAVEALWLQSSSRTSPMSGEQLSLPHLMSTMTVGQIIPAGYLLLWDNVANEVVEGITFKYASQTSVTAEGVALTTGITRYRVVVAGASLTGTVDHLADSFDKHNHSGQIESGTGAYMGHRINHYDLAYNIDQGENGKPGFTTSYIGPARHPHPQYLHRYGYTYQWDSPNLDNALLGDLVISNRDEEISTAEDSHSLYFASDYDGPRLKYDSGDDRLEIRNKDVFIRENLTAQSDLTVGDNLLIYGTTELQDTLEVDGTTTLYDGVRTDAATSILKWTTGYYSLTGTDISNGWADVTVTLTGIGGSGSDIQDVASVSGYGDDSGTAYAINSVPTSDGHYLHTQGMTISSSVLTVRINIGASWSSFDPIILTVFYGP